ncbi:MAG: hypothetical protein KC933_10000 [Myxococcales bacterium]|nr:hypothetical protein [Myxococcales bacterium]
MTTWMERVLRGLLAVMLVGAGALAHTGGSPISGLLGDAGWAGAAGLDEVAGYVLYATAALVLLMPRGRWLARAVVPAAVWLTLVPLAKVIAGGDFAALAPLGQGNRVLGLVALALLTTHQPGAPNAARSVALLRLGAAAVFLGHGLEALLQHPQFVDYLLVTARRAAGFPLAEAATHPILYVIGVVDVVVALSVWRGPHRLALGWACFWGFATAAMRLVYYGPLGGAPHAAVRALNGGGELILLMSLQAGLHYPTWGPRLRRGRIDAPRHPSFAQDRGGGGDAVP